MVEECKEEQPELQISTFEEAKTKGGNSINIIARVRGVIQREKNRTVHLVDNRDYLTLVQIGLIRLSGRSTRIRRSRTATPICSLMLGK